MDDDEIRGLVERLSRSHASGGAVIERAAILAAGTDSAAVLAWIAAHAGVAERAVPAAGGRGVHSRRLSEAGEGAGSTPLRYVLPPGALSAVSA